MDRRNFLSLPTAFAAASAVALTIKQPDGSEVSADVGVLRLKAGDRVVLRFQHRLSPTVATHIKEQALAFLPKGVEVAIMDNGADIGVLRPE